MEQIKLKRFLEILSLILVPPGLTAVCCQFGGLDTNITAGICLLFTIITSIYLFKSIVDRHLPSVHLLTGVFILISIVIYLFTSRESIKNVKGIKTYQQSSQFQNDFENFLKSTKNDVSILCTSTISHLPTKQIQIIEKLKNGVNIRYIVLDPLSPTMPWVAKDFGLPLERLEAENKTSLYALINLRNEWEKIKNGSPVPGHLEIRLLDGQLHTRMYVFDRTSSNGSTILVPYMNQHGSMTLPAFNFSNGTYSTLLSEYWASFEKIWNNSTDLQQFLNLHPEFGLPPVAN